MKKSRFSDGSIEIDNFLSPRKMCVIERHTTRLLQAELRFGIPGKVRISLLSARPV